MPYFDRDASGPFPVKPPCTMEDLLTLYPIASARSKDDPIARESARIATSELQAAEDTTGANVICNAVGYASMRPQHFSRGR